MRGESWQVPYRRAAGNQPCFYSSSSLLSWQTDVKSQRGSTLRPQWDKMALRGGWCHLAICIFRQQLLQRTIQRCRHWPCGTAVLRVKAAHIHMQTNHKRTDSFAAWVFKNIYTRLYLFYLEFQDLLIAHSSIQGNPAPRIQALAYSAEGWLREHGRTAVRSCTGCRKTQPNPQIQACSRRTACKSCCRKMEWCGENSENISPAILDINIRMT